MSEEKIRAEAARLLYEMGLTENYAGFFYIVEAVCLGAEDPQRLCLVTKLIYPDVARKGKTTAGAVERGIRLAISRVWSTDPALLARLSPVPLTGRPTSGKFLAILAAHVRSML